MRRLDRRLAAMTAYGFVSGLPLPLSGFTFRYWLSEVGVGLTVIGLTTSIGLAYSLKFLWSPLLDQAPPLGLSGRFGRRRGWLLLVQPLLCIAALLLALSDPSRTPLAAVAAAAGVAILSATQDIAIDAWRIETFPEERQGVALAVYVWGYRLAMLVSMSGVIAMASIAGWHAALVVVAAMIGAGVLVTLAATREEQAAAPRPRLRDAVVEPVLSFFARPSAGLVLAFVALFKLGEALAGLMTAPFYRSLGFDKPAIAGIGPFSMFGTLAGISLGGWLVARIGVGRALLVTGWTQTLAMAMYVLLSLSPGNLAMLYGTVAVEAFAQGMADAAFLTFLSALCVRAFAATQYALLSSVPQLAIHTIGNISGVMAKSLGWTLFYTVCMAAAVPGMLLMLVLLRRERTAAVPKPAQ
ncbi:AmpG family muropeptide MFS transporter [Rhodopila sp.]|uniref:AmpG family muropeptide MFS transporter n=1 Tax=Rhodopila sp. TaxID=2480087 RepID=UPI002C3DEAAD|nr:MFS transporter [Rhodopila sp.]HVZ10490.1 MFS transporter [Rhodopila sp.]